MDFLVINRPILTETITAYQKAEGNKIPFVVTGLNICLPNTRKEEVDKIVKDNYRSEKDRILKKDAKYYILMKGTTIDIAERAVNRLKAKLGLISRNFRCCKDTNRIKSAAFILGTSMITERFEFKYVDLTFQPNFFSKGTHCIPSSFKGYLKYSKTPKDDTNMDNSMINIFA